MAGGRGGARTRTSLSSTDGAYSRRAAMAGAVEETSEDDEAAKLWDSVSAADGGGGRDEDSSPSSRLLSGNEERAGVAAEPRSATAVADWDDGAPVTSKTVAELLLCIMAFVGRGFCLNSLGPTLMDLRQMTGVPVEDSAIIFMSQSAGLFVGSLAAKQIFDRINHELVMALALLGQAICTATVPVTPLLSFMCIAFGGQGFFLGVVGIGVTTLCLKLGGQKRNGMYLQAVYLGVSVGSIVGPFMAKPFLSVEARHQGSSKIIDLLLATKAPPSDHIPRSAGFDGNGVPLPIRNASVSTDAGSLLLATIATLLPDSSTLSAAVGVSSSGPNLNLSSQILVTSASSASFIEPLNEGTEGLNYTSTNVVYAYVLIATILAVPSMGFFFLYTFRNRTKCFGLAAVVTAPSTPGDKLCFGCFSGPPLEVFSCSSPRAALFLALLFLQCLVFFGMQDSYSNLLTTFVVLSDLRLPKVRGVYATSTFWAAVCFGRLNGIWIARFVSPYKMLLVDTVLAVAAAVVLLSFGQRSEYVLWVFSAVLGLAFATVNAATVSWAASRVSSNGYLLTIIMVGRCTGLLTVPTAVAAVFRAAGAMSLMRALMAVTILHLLCLTAAELIVKRCSVGGKLYEKQQATLACSRT